MYLISLMLIVVSISKTMELSYHDECMVSKREKKSTSLAAKNLLLVGNLLLLWLLVTAVSIAHKKTEKRHIVDTNSSYSCFEVI